MPTILFEGKSFRVELAKTGPEEAEIIVDGKRVGVRFLHEFAFEPRTLLVKAGQKIMRLALEDGEAAGEFSVGINGQWLDARLETERPSDKGRRKTQIETGPVIVNSPMAGRIVSVKTEPGISVVEGQALVLLEAMKMENEVASPRRGVVKELYVKQGDLVKTGDRLCLVE